MAAASSEPRHPGGVQAAVARHVHTSFEVGIAGPIWRRSLGRRSGAKLRHLPLYRQRRPRAAGRRRPSRRNTGTSKRRRILLRRRWPPARDFRAGSRSQATTHLFAARARFAPASEPDFPVTARPLAASSLIDGTSTEKRQNSRGDRGVRPPYLCRSPGRAR